MLCVPLLVDDRVVGVLELLDKRGDDSFNLTDMQSLGGFLRQAAESIERSHLRRAVMAVLANELRRLAAEVQGRTAPSASELEWSDSRQRQSFEIGQLACDVASTPNIATTTAVLLSTFERYASSQVGRRG
jgi:GAF domain-containing protein